MSKGVNFRFDEKNGHFLSFNYRLVLFAGDNPVASEARTENAAAFIYNAFATHSPR